MGAAPLTMKPVDPNAFRSWRNFAARIGLTSKDHSTAGKQRHGGITRAGDEALRAVLAAGAMAVIRQAKLGRGKASGAASAWLLWRLACKPLKRAAVALDTKIARPLGAAGHPNTDPGFRFAAPG